MKKYVYSRSGNFLRRRSHAKDGAKVIDQATRLGLTLPALNQQLPFLLENDRAVGTLEKSKGIRSSTKGDPKMTKVQPRQIGRKNGASRGFICAVLNPQPELPGERMGCP
ncbi:hypothetical protein HZH66_005457 [Vespula vulgaris]|uniref:Uncharacterized protein n=1 Tax=Vespula vulgaris TaxID=7454 RepID=A0A834K569_VESVU|nr:hypothetical protein HZH66_005457 [Vespula vulgaris]